MIYRFLPYLLSLISNERGVVEGEAGAAGEGTQGGEGGTSGEAGAGAAGAQGAGQSQESFIDPADLPEELKPHWKRMQGTFTKKMQMFKAHKEKADMVDRFQSDPEYAKATIRQMAAQLGITVSEASAVAQGTAGMATGSGQGAPPELTETMRKQLPPEYQDMAPMFAQAFWAGHKLTMVPIAQAQQQERQSRLSEDYDAMAGEMTGKYPGWEEKEDEMIALDKFLQSGRYKHPQFGSRLEMLYRVLTSDAHAISEATLRMGQAGRSKTTSGQAGRTSMPDMESRVMKHKTMQGAFQEAAKVAGEILEREGINVPP